MVASNSQITDMPIFPDELVPKLIQGVKVTTEWFPFIHGICIDSRQKPLSFYISINASLGGPKFAFMIKDQTYEGSFDISARKYRDGVLTIGTLPKFQVDYHHPHKARIDINPAMYVELKITYRGPPLWYGRGIDPAFMFPLTPTSFVGGFDAPCKIEGTVSSRATSLLFSGYGVYEHTWILGSFRWEEADSRWIIFNDDHSYGVATKTFDMKTGKALGHTGRFGMTDGPPLTFDDMEWVDDNMQPPRFVNIKGPIRDLNGTVRGKINLRTIQSVNLFVPSIWTQHRMIGTVNATTFDGSGWSETHKFQRSHLSNRVSKALHKLYPFVAEKTRELRTKDERPCAS